MGNYSRNIATRLRFIALGGLTALSGGVAGAESRNLNADWQDRFMNAIREEQAVVEAMFPNKVRSSFWASLRDNGTRRDGYADYLCLLLFESGMPKANFVMIHIWDAGAMARGDMQEIGRSDCGGH